MSKVTVRVNRDDDALYFRLIDSVILESEEVCPGVILDFDESGEVVGVEFLGIAKKASQKELSSIHFETG